MEFSLSMKNQNFMSQPPIENLGVSLFCGGKVANKIRIAKGAVVSGWEVRCVITRGVIDII